MHGRIIFTSIHDAYWNLALEEAIQRLNDMLTIRIWDNELSVIIGRAQLARFETDLEECTKRSIPIVRRISAGGAVYNGPGNLNWSFFIPRGMNGKALRYERDVKKVLSMVAAIITKALRMSGASALFREPSMITVNGAKVSGMAAFISKDSILCHGTLLYNANLEEVAILTTPVRKEIAKRYVRSNFQQVGNVKIEPMSFADNVIEIVESENNILLEESKLRKEERELADSLLREKYSREEWNLGDPFKVNQMLDLKQHV